MAQYRMIYKYSGEQVGGIIDSYIELNCTTASSYSTGAVEAVLSTLPVLFNSPGEGRVGGEF